MCSGFILFLTVVFFSFALQTLCMRVGIDTKVSGRLILINNPIISQWSLRTLKQLSKFPWAKLGIWLWAVVRTIFIISKVCNEMKMGNKLQQYRLVVGLHSVNLVTKEFWRCSKGKFWCSVVLLFYLERMSIGYLEPLVSKTLTKMY